MHKLLIISGPTATGKTALAIKLAKKFNGELISADSRQLYQGMDIGTGKDHPIDTPIHLIDLITPNKSFSVAEYRQHALTVIAHLQRQNKLPILVGCSGFYIDSVINPRYNTFSVKPNFLLRKILFHFPTPVLQSLLKIIDKKTFSLLNNSDVHNPLRLVRKIEIKLSSRGSINAVSTNDFEILHLSLTCPNSFLYPRIDKRVDERLKMGHLQELKSLLKKYSWTNPGLKISAYHSLKPYFEKNASLENCLQKWKFLEHRDARRQKTWFKKIPNITYVDITKPGFTDKTIALIKKWYNSI